MKSLILTVLYLAKDTVHRWFTRISSPVARVLVVFFLTLCALASLGSYVISTNVVRDKIIRRGGNLVVATLNAGGSQMRPYIPTQSELEKELNAESYVLRYIGSARQANGRYASLFTFDFPRFHQMLPLLAPSGAPTLLQDPADAPMPAGPTDVTLYKTPITVYARILPEDHPLLRVMRGNGLLVQPDDVPAELARQDQGYYVLALRIRDIQSSEPVMRAEQFLRTYMRMENLNGPIISATPLLKEMDDVLSKQTQCRIAFCVGISGIVGILLTALAGMEYRQNEYIYTLMKSFGIHPLLLVGAFITENLLIVGASFAGAIATFMYFQRMIVTQILKLGNYSLNLHEIAPEIALISYTLLGCVIVSSAPIFVAANREIGRVLK